MRIGLISDIHGDAARLTVALSRLDEAGVSAILCAGDVVNRGAEADAAIRALRARNIPMIKGNHEHSTLYLHPIWAEYDSRARLARVGRSINDDSLAYIRTLPETQRFTFAGVRVLLAHGAPWNDLLRVGPSSPPRLWEQFWERLATDTDVVILGHTHTPMHLILNETLHIINPGSVCYSSPRDSGTCGVYDVAQKSLTVFSLNDATHRVMRTESFSTRKPAEESG